MESMTYEATEKPPEAETGTVAADFSPIGKANYVYFVRAVSLGLIKIGIAKCYSRRLSAMQTGSPDKLELMGLIRPDDGEDLRCIEQRLHAEFRYLHSHGEWFHPGPRLLSYIAANAITAAENQRELAQRGMSKRQAA